MKNINFLLGVFFSFIFFIISISGSVFANEKKTLIEWIKDGKISMPIEKFYIIDTETFEVINANEAKDKNNYYIVDHLFFTIYPYSLIDIDTFKVLKNGYAKDKNNIYFDGNIVEGIDINTFEIIDIQEKNSENAYLKDKSSVFYRDQKIENADPKTFVFYKKGFFKDEKYFYSNGDIYLYGDINNSDLDFNIVEELTKENIVSGDINNNFNPEKEVTRIEFLKIVLDSKYSTEEISRTEDTQIIDIKSDTYKKYINFAKNKGIISGYPDNTFKPDQIITKAEAIKILVNTFIEKTKEMKGNKWYLPFIKKLEEKNIEIFNTSNLLTKNDTTDWSNSSEMLQYWFTPHRCFETIAPELIINTLDDYYDNKGNRILELSFDTEGGSQSCIDTEGEIYKLSFGTRWRYIDASGNKKEAFFIDLTDENDKSKYKQKHVKVKIPNSQLKNGDTIKLAVITSLGKVMVKSVDLGKPPFNPSEKVTKRDMVKLLYNILNK
jgi:hypothetical protein